MHNCKIHNISLKKHCIFLILACFYELLYLGNNNCFKKKLLSKFMIFDLVFLAGILLKSWFLFAFPGYAVKSRQILRLKREYPTFSMS